MGECEAFWIDDAGFGEIRSSSESRMLHFAPRLRHRNFARATTPCSPRHNTIRNKLLPKGTNQRRRQPPTQLRHRHLLRPHQIRNTQLHHHPHHGLLTSLPRELPDPPDPLPPQETPLLLRARQPPSQCQTAQALNRPLAPPPNLLSPRNIRRLRFRGALA